MIAAPDRCPHREAPLSLGSVEGGCLSCCYHGWTFGETIVASTWLDPFSALAVVALVIAAATRPIALAVLGTVPLLLLGQYWYTVYLAVPVLTALVPR